MLAISSLPTLRSSVTRWPGSYWLSVRAFEQTMWYPLSSNAIIFVNRKGVVTIR